MTINSNNKFSVVTVDNWALYQGSDSDEEQQSNNKVTTKEQQKNNKRTTKEQQSNTNKNVKNVKNEKNVKNNIYVLFTVENSAVIYAQN